jgi:hypothetical protein
MRAVCSAAVGVAPLLVRSTKMTPRIAGPSAAVLAGGGIAGGGHPGEFPGHGVDGGDRDGGEHDRDGQAEGGQAPAEAAAPSPCRSWPRLVTSPGSGRRKGWSAISGSTRGSARPAGSRTVTAGSPRPAGRMPAGCWWTSPGRRQRHPARCARSTSESGPAAACRLSWLRPPRARRLVLAPDHPAGGLRLRAALTDRPQAAQARAPRRGAASPTLPRPSPRSRVVRPFGALHLDRRRVSLDIKQLRPGSPRTQPCQPAPVDIFIRRDTDGRAAPCGRR